MPVGGGHADALDHGIGPGLGAERVEGDRDRSLAAARRRCRRIPRRARWTSSSVGLVERDDLATRVGAAGRADAVRHPRAVALRALVQARRGDRVVSATLVAAGARLSLLRDGHEAGNRSGRAVRRFAPRDVVILTRYSVVR